MGGRHFRKDIIVQGEPGIRRVHSNRTLTEHCADSWKKTQRKEPENDHSNKAKKRGRKVSTKYYGRVTDSVRAKAERGASEGDTDVF